VKRSANIRDILRRLHRQRPLVMLLAVVLGAVLILSATFAWFTQSDIVKNELKTQQILFRFEIAEDFKVPDRVDPGDQIGKVIDVKNTGDKPGFVRLLVLPEIVSENGELLEATPGVTFTYDLNTTYWTDGGDGYYYYRGKLDPGQTTTEPLFTTVTMTSGLGSEYNNAKMKIEVKLEAAQTVRAKYREAWWHNGDVAPSSPALISIDDALKALAQ